MQAKFVRRQYQWVKVDTLSAVGYPVIFVVALTALGLLALQFGLTQSWYSSPYVMLAAVASNRVCVRAGVLCAGLGALAHNYIFVPPTWSFSLPSSEQGLAYLSMFVGAIIVGRKELPPSSEAPPMPPGRLPFTRDVPVRPDSTTREFWAVEPSGNWSSDTQLGSEYGRIYLDSMRRSNRGPLLGWIVSDMIRNGHFTGVEAGFLGVVGRAAIDPGRPIEHRHELLAAQQDADNRHA